MSGSTFTIGVAQTRPGTYVAITNAGPAPGLPNNIVAAPFQADWGPLGVPVFLNSYESVAESYQSGATLDLLQQVFLGGAGQVVAYRLGTSGNAKAHLDLNDTSGGPVHTATVTALYDGTFGNSLQVTIQDNLVSVAHGDSPALQDFIVSQGTQILQTVTFNPGADAAAALVAAMISAGSPWVTVVATLSAGSGVLAPLTSQALAGGLNPSAPVANDYSLACDAFESLTWNVFVPDVDDSSRHDASPPHVLLTQMQGYIDRVRNQDGKRVMGVFGALSSFSLKFEQAALFNDPAIVYVANGFVVGPTAVPTPNATVEGYAAAGRVAGMIAASSLVQSITHSLIPDAVAVTGGLTNNDYITALQSGAFVFSLSAGNQPEVEYAITTLTTLTPNLDAGWKKIRRVRTRDSLVSQVIAAWDPLVGKVNNTLAGQTALISAATVVITALTAMGALKSGSCTLDPNNPPAGDSAWFVLQVQDVDSIEFLYLTVGFQF